MEFNKINKPVHLKCPKCEYDFSLNVNYVDRNINKLKKEISDINSQLTVYKAKNNKVKNNDEWYNNTIMAKRIKEKQISELKEYRNNLNENIELQIFQTFKQLVKSECGEATYVRLIQEAEDMLVYNNYDNAIQKHNSFENS